ncbi:MAG: hypothetical protein OXK80_02685 [Bdellovibrionales bacterium]|nr:hypothetical protein [Bdellovibrionales bacterium]
MKDQNEQRRFEINKELEVLQEERLRAITRKDEDTERMIDKKIEALTKEEKELDEKGEISE